MSVPLFAGWLVLVWAMGWLALPLSSRLWRGDSLCDGGLAAGRVLLLCIWTMAAFLAGNAGVPVRWSALAIFPVLIVLAVICGRERQALTAVLNTRRDGIRQTELFFLLVFALFFVLRCYMPGIDNGEKPMDMALISACARADSLPPPNPYAAGLRLESYYYLGHLQTALLTESIGGTPRWTYNLMCATLPALCFSVLVSLASALCGHRSRGALATLLVLGAGTLQPIAQWVERYQQGQLSLNGPCPFWSLDYMATSRVIPYTINEYPWFTFNYADLHAHYFAMPLALLIICIGWAIHGRLQLKPGLPGKLLLVAAVVLGAQIVTNTWDFPVYTIYIALCLGTLLLPRRTLQPATGDEAVPPPFAYRLLVMVVASFGLGLVAMLLAGPFLLRLHSEANRPALLPQPGSPTLQWLMMWGLPAGAWLTHLAVAACKRGTGRPALACAMVMVAIWAALGFANGQDHFVLLFLVLLTAWTGCEIITADNERDAWLARLAFCGCLSLLWSETTWAGFLGSRGIRAFDDYKRQDTVFKFGLQAWYLLGIAAACAALRLWAHREPDLNELQRLWRPWHRWPLRLGASLLPVAVLSSISVLCARADFFRTFGEADAWSYLAPAERGAAAWLSAHAAEGDHLIEAELQQGGDYSEYTRYTHATGVPAVIGPKAHTFQWGVSWDEVDRRKQAVRDFYTGATATRYLTDAERLAILRRYNVRYVMCGLLERIQYGDEAVKSIERLLPQTYFDEGENGSRVSIRRAP